MKNGTILLTTSGPAKTWYARWIVKMIRKASGFDFDHTRGLLDGWTYETRHPEGFRKSEGWDERRSSGRVFLEPIRDLTEGEVKLLKEYFEVRVSKNKPYNYAKLILSLLLWRTRPFWEWLKWVPFQNDTLWGDHCSGAWDEAYLYAGIDLLPDGYEELTTPGDFTKSKFFKEI